MMAQDDISHASHISHPLACGAQRAADSLCHDSGHDSLYDSLTPFGAPSSPLCPFWRKISAVSFQRLPVC